MKSWQRVKRPRAWLLIPCLACSLALVAGCGHGGAGSTHYLSPKEAGLGAPVQPGLPPGMKITNKMAKPAAPTAPAAPAPPAAPAKT